MLVAQHSRDSHTYTGSGARTQGSCTYIRVLRIYSTQIPVAKGPELLSSCGPLGICASTMLSEHSEVSA